MKKSFVFSQIIGFVFLSFMLVSNSFGQVVINEIYGGGGNAGALFNQDFIELYNPSDAPVTLSNVTLQYSTQGSTSYSIAATINATIPAGGYYLISVSNVGGTGAAIPTPDLIGAATNLNTSNAKVALVQGTTAVTVCSAGAGQSFIDRIGYGTTSQACREGNANVTSPSNNISSMQRLPEGDDTDENGADFALLNPPTPRNSNFTPPTITNISDQTIPVNGTTGALNFTISDGQTPVGSLIVTTLSDNTALIPNANIVIGGTTPNLTLTATPNTGQSGISTITLTVTDADGQSATLSFVVIVGTVPQCAAGGEISVTPDSPSASNGGVVLYVSSQTDVAATADTQDDAWRSATTSASLASYTQSGLNGTNKNAAQDISVTGTGISGFTGYNISTREMPSGTNINIPPCKGKNITGGKFISSNNVSLQSASVRPTVSTLPTGFFSYSENLGGLNANSGARNALLFEFSASVRAFGAWFGDVEGRTDATPITVRLFDSGGARIGNDFVINETTAPFGNLRTRWIGFLSAAENVKSMLVMVGDDDAISLHDNLFRENFAPQQGQGFSEHLSFVGGTFAHLTPSAALSAISGRVTDERGNGIGKARINLLNTDSFESTTILTNPFGYFRFEDLPTGDFYVVTVRHKRYVFNQNTQAFRLLQDENNLIFTGTEP